MVNRGCQFSEPGIKYLSLKHFSAVKGTLHRICSYQGEDISLFCTTTMSAINTFRRLLLGWKSHTLGFQLSICSAVKGVRTVKNSSLGFQMILLQSILPLSFWLVKKWPSCHTSDFPQRYPVYIHRDIQSKAETVSGTKSI